MSLISIPPVNTIGKVMVEGFTDQDGDKFAAFISPDHKVEIGMVEADGFAWWQVGPPVKCRDAKHAQAHAEATLDVMENATLADLVAAIPQ